MEVKITLFFHCYSNGIPMEIPVSLPLVLFHCYTNEITVTFPPQLFHRYSFVFLVVVFFNITEIPLVLFIKKVNGII